MAEIYHPLTHRWKTLFFLNRAFITMYLYPSRIKSTSNFYLSFLSEICFVHRATKSIIRTCHVSFLTSFTEFDSVGFTFSMNALRVSSQLKFSKFQCRLSKYQYVIPTFHFLGFLPFLGKLCILYIDWGLNYVIMMESHGTKTIGRSPSFPPWPAENITSSGSGPDLGSLGIFTADFFLNRQPKY